MVDPVAPTRKEIEDIVRQRNGVINTRVVRALERLFEVAGDETPEDLQTAILQAENALNAANSLAAELSSLIDALGTMAYQEADNVDIDGGDIGDVTFSGTITNSATLNGGTYNTFTITGTVTNSGTLSGGTYSAYTMAGSITNSGTVSGGTFSAPTLSGTITNSGTISGGNASGITVTGGSVDSTLTDDQNTLLASSTTLNDNSGAGAGTLTNAPTAGDPTKWVEIDDNGTSRYIPTWT